MKARVEALEARKLHDERVDALLCEIKRLHDTVERFEVVNRAQSEAIETLKARNCEQDRQIVCLNEKINRTAILLDGKVDNVEKHVLAEERVDLNQNTAIKLLQSQICELKEQMQVLTRTAYVKDCSV